MTSRRGKYRWQEAGDIDIRTEDESDRCKAMCEMRDDGGWSDRVDERYAT